MLDSFNLIKPFLHRMDPECAHGVTIAAMKMGLSPKFKPVQDDRLKIRLWDREFANPVGLAAGFDKKAEVIGPLFDMGFGFVEVGTVTPKPQDGNPKPRVFRDAQNEAVINRMGFPNHGLQPFLENILAYNSRAKRPNGIVGINIGMNKDQTEAEKDYRLLIKELAQFADYLTINVSSPNTPGLRNLQEPEHLKALIKAVMEQRAETCGDNPPPVLIKLAPDLTEEEQEKIAHALLHTDIDGIILTNTTLDRPTTLPEKFRNEKGGLSGRPLREKSTKVIRNFYKLTKGKLPIIGIGGVSSGQDAYDKICAGASLVQLYSALVFKGPALPTQMCRDLLVLLERDGHKNLTDAVGCKN